MRLTILMSILIASAAAAQEAKEPQTPPPLAAIECYCTDRTGTRVELGDTICLTVDGRAFLARCEMSLNSPMWRDTGGACVGARVASPVPSETAVF